MNREHFLEHVKERNEDRLRLLIVKGAAYSVKSDAFENFKRNGERLGLTKYQIWAVYCGKHLDAIFNSIKENPVDPVDRSEGLIGRIDDAINYLNLFSGMLYEDGIKDDTSISGGNYGFDGRKRPVDKSTTAESGGIADPMEGRAVD